VNDVDFYGHPPPQRAVERGNAEAVKILLKHGVDVSE